MKQLTELYHAIVAEIPQDKMSAELTASVKEAAKFLKATHALSYAGHFEQPNTLLKLVDIGVDMDDMVKSFIGRNTNIKFEGELYLIIYPEKAEDAKAS